MLRSPLEPENLSLKGGYVVREPEGGRDVTLIATGSEVGLAADAAALLDKEGVKAAVVSLPSFELFRAQPEAYRNDVLGKAPRVGIEAGVEQGWREWLRRKDAFVGLSDFGASAPGAKVFEHFGLTPAKVAEAARAAMKRQ
jgi:transketolase